MGPARGGRVTAVAGHPAQPSTFYMGATGGGVWKTENFGVSWTPVSDGYFHTGSIGSIRVAPSDPNVVWVGTGSDGIRSNVIVGRGIYRSDDAGRTWARKGLEDAGQLGAVAIHPDDPNTVFVAALGNPFGQGDSRGVYRTRDGGESWDQVLFVSDSVGVVDLELHPANPNVVYAAAWRGERKPWTIISGMAASAREDGIWRSEDGGENWEYVALELASDLIGKIDLGVSAADPDRVYALVESVDEEEGLYRSDDAGRSFTLVPGNQPRIMDRPFYYTNVDVDPTDADVLYASATQFWKSTDGGRTWQRRGTPHGDNHDLWINPDNPLIQIQSNDGGANVTVDGGETWSTQHNQPTAELYQVDIDDRFPYWLYAGQQDNSTIMVPSNPPADGSAGGHTGDWRAIGGCETGPAVPKPGDPDVVYANCKGRFGLYSRRTGQERQYYVGAANMYGHNPADLVYRFQRVVPIEVSPHDPNVVFHGSQFVHRTVDGGITWEQISPDLTAFRPERQVASGEPITRDITGEEHYSVLYAIEESPLARGVIWTGANDGPVHVTRNGGLTWTDVTPPGMPPEGRIQTVEPSPHDPAKAYVAGYRYLLGDFKPYIYRTEDYGETWTHLTPGNNGIPADFPTRAIREDPDRAGLLYAGTEFGMFISFDDGGTWASFQQNLPVTPITDIKVHQKDLVLSTMGRSFWIMDDLTLLHQVSDGVMASGANLFRPRDTHRLRGGGFGGFGEQDPAEPEYLSPGVLINYALGDEADEVSLEILDRSGAQVLREFRATGAGTRTEEGQEMRGPFQVTRGAPRLENSAGLHRFIWDMREAGVGGQGAGALVLPGDYAVRLSVGGETFLQPIRIDMDPRVVAEGVTLSDLKAQYDLRQVTMALVAEARDAADEAEGMLVAAVADQPDGNGGLSQDALDELRAIHRQLSDVEGGSYQQPMLVAQASYLDSMLRRADQRPGADAYARYNQLRGELDEILARLEPIRRAMGN